MKILLVNDDGIYAQGIITLANTLLRHNHSITMIAPHKQMSGTSHSLTFCDYLNYKKLEIIEGVESYALSGSPADCVKFGLEVILQDNMPDCVISGINIGHNLSTDVLYSGTVNASLEASILGVASIAVSQDRLTENFEFSSKFIAENLQSLLQLLPKDNSIIFNINFPACEDNQVKGYKFSCVGQRFYCDKYVFKEGKGYYLTGYPLPNPNNSADCDDVICADNFISISPVKADYNCLDFLSGLEGKKL